jgi:protein-L-isoaspartate(D-aspartate) O-methyltransferase
LAALGVDDRRVLAAVRAIPRAPFGLDERLCFDDPLAQRAPEQEHRASGALAALMVQSLRLSGTGKVLDVGTGSGYRAALLSRLATEVYSVEQNGELANIARRRMHDLGFHNVRVLEGDGSKGLPVAAPYDAIAVGAAAYDVPTEFVDQLADGGRIIMPLGDAHSQLLVCFHKCQQALESTAVTWCTLARLLSETPPPPSRRPWTRESERDDAAKH